MGIAYTTHGASKSSATAAASVATTVTAVTGECIVVAVATALSVTANTPTDNATGSSNTYIALGTESGTTYRVTFFGCATSKSNVTTVTCTFSSSRYGIAISTYTGVSGFNQSNVSNVNVGSSSTPQVSLPNALTNGNWGLGAFSNQGTGTWSEGVSPPNLRDHIAGAGSTTPGVAICDNTSKLIGVSLSSGGATGNVTAIELCALQTQTLTAALAAFNGTVAKKGKKVLAGAIHAFNAVLARVHVYHKTLTAAIGAFNGTLAKAHKFAKTLTAAIPAFNGVLTRIHNFLYKIAFLGDPQYWDTFNRANADLTSPWTSVSGTLTIVSDQLQPKATGYAWMYYNATTPNDQFSQIAIEACNSTVTDQAGTEARFTNASNFYQLHTGGPIGSPGFVYLQKTASGSSSYLASGILTVNVGDVLKLTCVGSTITAYQNNVQIFQATDSALASGKTAIYSYCTTSTSNVIFGPWAGGSMGPISLPAFKGSISKQLKRALAAAINAWNGTLSHASIFLQSLTAALAAFNGIVHKRTNKILQPTITIESDNFNRADENPLAAPWTITGSSNALQIVSDIVECQGVGLSPSVMFYDAPCAADQFSQATIVNVTNLTDTGVTARDNGSNSFYDFHADNSFVYFEKTISGSTTSFSITSMTINPGDVIKITTIGSTITGYINGVQVAQATDTDLTSGKPGLYADALFGSVLTDAQMDNWSGGSIATTPGLPAWDGVLSTTHAVMLMLSATLAAFNGTLTKQTQKTLSAVLTAWDAVVAGVKISGRKVRHLLMLMGIGR